MGWVWCRCDAHKKQVDVKQWYNPVQQEVQLVGVRVLEIRCQCENQLQTEGLWSSGPPVEQLRRMRKKCCYSQNMLQFCSVSNSPLTRNPFATISNKVWEVYFSKELYPFVILVLTMFLHAYKYVKIVPRNYSSYK